MELSTHITKLQLIIIEEIIKLEIYDFISLSATLCVIIGVWFLAKPILLGQYVMLIAQTLWISYSLIKPEYNLLPQSITLWVINVKAIFSWKKRGIK